MEPPSPADGALADYLALAVDAGAQDVLRTLARSTKAPPDASAEAIRRLLDDPDGPEAALALAGDALADPLASAQRRRQLLERLSSDLVGRDEPGLAVLRRVADHDPSPYVRDAAARILRDEEDD
jgi:hypothetical protein